MVVRADGQGAVVEVAQRPVPLVGAILGAIVVGGWVLAILFSFDGLLHGRPLELLSVFVALGLRSFVATGRRLDERRLRLWLTGLLAAAPTRPAARAGRDGASTVARRFGPPRYDVPAADCR